MPFSSNISIMLFPPSNFYYIGATKMKNLEANTYAGLFPNHDVTFPYKGSVYKVAFIWQYFVKGEIFGLYLSISGPVAIIFTFWVVNQMLSDANFKLIIHFDASNSWVTRWCLSQVTDMIKNSARVGGCTLTISVVTSFNSFHSWLILTDLTIIEWRLDMFITVSMDLFKMEKFWVDLLPTGSVYSFIIWYIYEISGYVTFYGPQLASSLMKTQGNCHSSSSDGKKESARILVPCMWSDSNTLLA